MYVRYSIFSLYSVNVIVIFRTIAKISQICLGVIFIWAALFVQWTFYTMDLWYQ